MRYAIEKEERRWAFIIHTHRNKWWGFNCRTMPHKSTAIDPHRFIVGWHNRKGMRRGGRRPRERDARQMNKNNSSHWYEEWTRTGMLPHSNKGGNAWVTSMKSKWMPLNRQKKKNNKGKQRGNKLYVKRLTWNTHVAHRYPTHPSSGPNQM